ncbi:hypothetical protein ABZ570_05750 [Micromonospora sp. NPDC007271]|uniref:hypothetical protein n=1 Tax=Micromonospora sp. NPDC007271 TaxID=3154587 RepID=UPI0033FDA865
MTDPIEVERIFRAQYGRAVAVLVRVLGDIDLAEDAVQDAFATAVERWAVDRLRREASRADRHTRAALLYAPDAPIEEGPVRDDRLCLIFTRCHPALNVAARVALTLRLLGGLSTAEIARAFGCLGHTWNWPAGTAERPGGASGLHCTVSTTIGQSPCVIVFWDCDEPSDGLHARIAA